MAQRRLFNDNWEFCKCGINSSYDEVARGNVLFEKVDIPHDWLIYDTTNLYEDGRCWYRKLFCVDQIDGKVVSLRFDGVYMDSEVYVNGHFVGSWAYGYSMFEFDITSQLQEGENWVYVSVTHQSPNSRWYSGAGIYRNVWLVTRNERHIEPDGIYITTRVEREGQLDGKWLVDIETTLCSESDGQIKHSLWYHGKQIVVESVSKSVKVHKDIETLVINQPYLWDITSPNLYELRTELYYDGQVVDEEIQTFGFRTTKFDSEKGFLLNERVVKLNGACEHHDLGALGAAFNTCAMRRKIYILQEMGVNAIRTTHNMPAKEFMELTDEMGILVVSEAFDMWEGSKNPYDYARFFKEWYKKDVRSWVMRDRNHPSLIMWSIGNEIYDTHANAHGRDITKQLMEEVLRYDPKQNARVTIGSNYMPWENAQACADIVKVAGYNYGEKYYKEQHEAHSDWIIYGSETSSTVQSRGIYHFPYEKGILSDDDEQCSSLGNSSTSWGAKSSEACIIADRDATFSMGQFIWTGFDYIGEPTPYHTKNSYFGQVDTAGFKKDSYYIYQAEWTNYQETPMVHIFPYWDFNIGQTIDVRVCSNAPCVELYVNGASQGKVRIDHKHGTELVAHYKVVYEPGKLVAYAYNELNEIIASDIRHSFGDAYKIKIEADKYKLLADGRDIAFLTISMLDKQGNEVENANNRVQVTVTGAGRLIGLDNGDSTDYDQYKGTSRRLFSGKLLAIVESNQVAGEITVEVISRGMEPRRIVLTSVEAQCHGITTYEKNKHYPSVIVSNADEDIPVRKIELLCESGNQFTSESTCKKVCAKIYPEDATDKQLYWSVVNDMGSKTNLATCVVEEDGALVTAMGDGTFRIRCMSRNNTNTVKLISQLDFVVTGLGKAYLNPYEFISGGVYTYTKGEVGNGNERGVASAREGETQIGYSNIDFGETGTEEITIPIFALSDEEYYLQIWEGIPNTEESSLLADVIYQKPSIWNVYQEETYKLNKRIKGITQITFVLRQKVHIKGFIFKEINKAFERLNCVDCNDIYGDSFTIEEDRIRDIGNNVSVIFKEMDFTSLGTDVIIIKGRSLVEKTSIHICYQCGEESGRQLVEFPYSEECLCLSFPLESIKGKQDITFVFLPGSKFDFEWFRFGRNEL